MADEAKKSTKSTKAETNSEDPKVTKDIVPSKYRDTYAANKGTCGDFIASELSALMDSDGIDSFKAVKKANNIPEAKWATLNNGQQRMNLSNALRAMFLRGEVINIRGKEFSLDAFMDEFIDDPKKFNGDSEPQVKKFLGFIDMPENSRNMGAVRKYFYTIPKQALEKAKRIEERDAKRKAKEEKLAKAREEKKARGASGKTLPKGKKAA